MSTTRRSFLTSAVAAAAQPGKDRPNILMLFPDQHRPDWTGFNPNLDVRTPNLSALARRGVRFTQAVVGSPLCAPSRACIASGKEYERCGVRDNKDNYPLDQVTFYKLLRDSGYHVMGCGKLDLHKPELDWGLDGRRLIKEWGFSDAIDNAGKMDAVASAKTEPKDPYMAMLYRRKLAKVHLEDMESRRKQGYRATFPTPLPDDAYCDNWIGQNGLDLLRESPKDKPWFLVVNFTGPHNPMDITRRMEAGARGRGFHQPNFSEQYSKEEHVAIRQNYTAMVENLDRWTGIYIDQLRKRGELDNTIVIYSSDHGEMLGDHNRWGKTVPYEPSVGVPLVAAGPGVEPGKITGAPVTLVDLAATFLDYAGVKKPADMDSRTLRPLLEGRTKTHRGYLLSGLNQWRMVREGPFKLITGFGADTAPILFDLKEDPLESRNLAGQLPGQVDRLARYLG
jgi:arylsulfatase